MTSILRVSVSLDAKLLTASGKPTSRAIPHNKIEKAAELELTFHPVVVGGSFPTLSGLPTSFQSMERRWRLLSVANKTDGCIVARYRRKDVRAKPV